MKSILRILIISSVLFSCKKGKADFILSGQISDLTFNQNLSGATIKLYQVKIGTSNEELIGTASIGNDGKYSFKFPRDQMEKYLLKVTKNNYFEIEETIYFSDLTTKEDNVRNFGTTAKSWVKLTFKNNNPLPDDHFRYIKQEGKENCTECCSAEEQNYYGALDTAIYCINDGNTYYSYYYWVVGTANQGIKAVNTSAFDTVELNLTY